MARKKKSKKSKSVTSGSLSNRGSVGDTTSQNTNRLDEILRTAASHFAAGTEEDILATLSPAEEFLSDASTTKQRTYRRLLALGQAHVNQLLDAEQTCLEGLNDEPGVQDFYFVLTYVAMSLREFDKARKWAQVYLEIQPKRVVSPDQANFCTSDAHRSQLINLLASAYMEKDELDEAVRYFRDAIDADTGNHLPYLNLANTYLRLHKRNDALEVIANGLSSCRQIGDLRLMQETYKKTATISACMMVKNEEELLPGCLDSIRDWVDEIIVVDTGSTDRTIEIAESYGAKIFHQPWEGNFSKHRNHSIELATCDWIFIIDADERYEPDHIDGLLKAVNSGEHEIISINVYNLYGSADHKLTAVNSMRFFLREMNLRYEGIVHNSLCFPDGARISRAPFVMQHLGYDLSPEKMLAKYERSHALIQKQIEENPDHGFAWFNLAQLYRGRMAEDVEKWGPKVIHAAKRVLELIGPDDPNRSHFFVMAHDQISWTEYLLGDTAEAQKWARKALELKPDYLDPLMLIAHCHAREQRLEEALAAYQTYLDAQAEYDEFSEIDSMILYHPSSLDTAYFGMGCVAELLGRKDQAETYYQKTLDHSPNYLQANLHLGRLYLERDDLVNAQKHFQSQNDKDKPHPLATVGLACIAVKAGRVDEASKLFNQALELDNEDVDILTKSAQFFAQVGEEARACELYERALQLHPEISGVAGSLAALLFSQAQFERAVQFYDKAIKEQPDNPDLRNDLGNCYYRLNDFEAAQREYRAALEFEQAGSITHRNLGLALARLGRTQESIDTFERFLGLEPDQVELFHVLGDLYVAQGDIATAIGYYEKSLSVNPTSVPVLFALSECYLQLGHQDSAIMGYRRVSQMSPDFEPAKARLKELTAETSEA